jgi:hypothetical protein
MEQIAPWPVVPAGQTRIAFFAEGNPMKHAVLFACLAAVLAGGCRREEAAPVYEPMKLGGATQNEMSR